MIQIYHNPRCRKSREALDYLKQTSKEFKVVKYLKNPVPEKTLLDIITKLNILPIELVRKKEAIWKSEFKGKDLTGSEIIAAMANNPKLIERPIIVNGSKAVIARPASAINTIL